MPLNARMSKGHDSVRLNDWPWEASLKCTEQGTREESAMSALKKGREERRKESECRREGEEDAGKPGTEGER